MIWLGGVAFTLFLVVLSITAIRWWPVVYVAAVFVGAGAGLLLREFPTAFRETWWLAWMAYIFALPLGKTIATRRRMGRRY